MIGTYLQWGTKREAIDLHDDDEDMERWQARQIGSSRTASTWWSRGEFSQLVHMQTISGNEHRYHYLQSSNIIMFVWVPDDRFHMDSVTKIPLKIENHLYIHTENTNNNHWYLKNPKNTSDNLYVLVDLTYVPKKGGNQLLRGARNELEPWGRSRIQQSWLRRGLRTTSDVLMKISDKDLWRPGCVVGYGEQPAAHDEEARARPFMQRLVDGESRRRRPAA